MTEAVLGKLEEAFAYDATIEEACFYADINPDTYYTYVKKQPQFSERVKALRQRPILAARKKVVESINADVKNAQWYLERRRSDEFGQRTHTDLTTLGKELPAPILGSASINNVHSDNSDQEAS